MKLHHRTSTMIATALLLAPLAAAQIPGSELWKTVQPDAGYFGSSVANAGDVDGDGIDDVIVGDHQADTDPNDDNAAEGAAHVYSGADGALIRTLWGGYPDGDFGLSVAGLGDLDGDGRSEVLVGASNDSGQGVARVFSGLDGSVMYVHSLPVQGGNSQPGFGHGVAHGGDLDGDGVSDYLVGAPGDDTGGSTNKGRIRCYSGATGALLHDIVPPVLNGTGQSLGQQGLSSVGDLDGDGYDDFVGVMSYSILLFSGQTGQFLEVFEQGGSTYGRAAAPVGDVDGDGRPEFVIGRQSENAFYGNGGRITLYGYSLTTGITPLWSVYGNYVNHGLGFAVSGLGDWNGDGIPDVLSGSRTATQDFNSEGLVNVHSGADGSLLFEQHGGAGTEQFGWAVAGGDLNQDGYSDLITTARPGGNSPNAGLDYVTCLTGGPDAIALYCEANPNSTGSPAQIATSGSTSIAANDLVLSAGPVPNTPGLYFFGPAQTALPFGDGVLCVTGGLKRLLPVIANGNTLTAAIDNTQAGVSNLLVPDSLWNFQAWFRDPAAGGAGFNTSNAVQVHFLP